MCLHFWSLLLGTRGSFGFSNYPITKLPDYPIGPTPSPLSQRSQYLLGFRGGYHNEITIFIGLVRFDMHKTQYPCGFPRFRPHNLLDHSRQLSISKGLSGSCLLPFRSPDLSRLAVDYRITRPVPASRGSPDD